MISENIISKVASLTAVGALAGTAGLTESTGVELSIVLWIVGGLLGVISILLAAICYFIRDMRNLNARQHDEMASHQYDLTERLSNLEGQHGAALNARGCAYDPIRLETAIKEVLRKEVND